MMGFNSNIAGMNNYYTQFGMGGITGMGQRPPVPQMMMQMMQMMMQMMQMMSGGGTMPMMGGMPGMGGMGGFTPMLGDNIGNFIGTAPQGGDPDGVTNQNTDGAIAAETPQQQPPAPAPQQAPAQQPPAPAAQQTPAQQTPAPAAQQTPDTATQGKKSGQKTGPPPGYKTMKGKIPPEVTAKAKSLLNQPMGTEIPFEANGKKYMARLETHYHPQGYVGGPNGYHKGCTVYEQA
ncbi:MAG: hypothetical protein ABRQ37_04845 [Candidatus Eremiobacterota bacterium]